MRTSSSYAPPVRAIVALACAIAVVLSSGTAAALRSPQVPQARPAVADALPAAMAPTGLHDKVVRSDDGRRVGPGYSDLIESGAADAAGPKPLAPPALPTTLPVDPVADAQAAAPEPPAAVPADVEMGDPAAAATPDPRFDAFRGLSTWLDLYDTSLLPQEQVAIAAAAGVQAVYVQTARYNSPTDLHDYHRLSTLIESAHDAGIRVMVWYIPDFLDPAVDLRRSQAAMALVTPRGDRPDAFGLDIEVDDLADVAERNRRLLDLSAALRAWAGPDYPMAAVVLPPLQLQLNTTWWPSMPYAELVPYYDVFVPMSYSSFRGRDVQTTYDWNLANVHELRRLTGVPDLPIHLAGGIANDLPEVGAFAQAAIDGGVLGGGLYDLHTTPPEAWQHLQGLRS